VHGFARIMSGGDTWSSHCCIPRHRHLEPYAALILSGGHEESGSFGRYRGHAGQVLLHRMFDAHLNRFGPSGAFILNLALDVEPAFGFGSVADPDAIARLAETDTIAATMVLKERLQPLEAPRADWPDLLAWDLLEDPGCRLDAWAERHGLAPETLSRGFGRVFATSPAGFRVEARARGALAQIARGVAPLAAVAADSGFADQAHMTRAVTALTGRPPSYWLRSSWFKTA
jgi:AraC-like DNA-binding protein